MVDTGNRNMSHKTKMISMAKVKSSFHLRSGRLKASTMAWISRGIELFVPVAFYSYSPEISSALPPAASIFLLADSENLLAFTTRDAC